MLLTQQDEPLESPEWITELKLDGIRCIAYIRPGETDLRNKRNIRLLPGFPELSEMHTAVTGTCILDGELIITSEKGKPDFEALQARSMMTDVTRIRIASRQRPATFVAFDLLYCDGNDLTDLSLDTRKCILNESIRNEGYLSISHVFSGSANALFNLTTNQGLEGIVQKRRKSTYQQGKRSKDWIKIKNLVEEDFLACGYIDKGHVVTLILGALREEKLVFQGHVTLGVSRNLASHFPTTSHCPFSESLPDHADVTWYREPHPCTVVYMERTSAGGMRQPRFKGFHV